MRVREAAPENSIRSWLGLDRCWTQCLVRTFASQQPILSVAVAVNQIFFELAFSGPFQLDLRSSCRSAAPGRTLDDDSQVRRRAITAFSAIQIETSVRNAVIDRFQGLLREL